MSMHTDDTLVHDITEAVDAVLNDPAMSKIVRRAGETAPLSDRDENALFDFVGAQPFMARFKEKYFESEPDFDRTNLLPTNERHLARLCNIWLVIAIARRVADGIYRSVGGEDAQKEIARNAVPRDIQWDASTNRYSWTPPKLAFREYFQILRDAWFEPNFDESVRRAIAALDEAGGDYHDRTAWGPARDALELILYKHLRKRGLSAKPRFWEPIMAIVGDEIDISNEEQVRRHLAKFDSTKIDWEMK